MNNRMIRRIGVEYPIKLTNQKPIITEYNRDFINVNTDVYKINQLRVSGGVGFFKNKLFKKFGLKPYANIYEPVIFNGFYLGSDYHDALKHKSHVSIVWCGTDALMVNSRNIQLIKQLKDVRHIAKSEFVYNTLKKKGIDSVIIPVTPTENKKNKKPRGNNIYFYTSFSDKSKYGYDLYEKIKNRVPHKIIVAAHNSHPKEKLDKIYESCFLGLRLTKHDGLPNTVVELGLMGRRCIYNGNLPNAISYKNVDDIVEKIKNEYNNRANDNSQIVDDMYNFLDIGDDWLKIKIIPT